MQIDIPSELLKRLQQRSSDPLEAIREALDSLDARDRELAAIQAGLESADSGNVKPLHVFDQDFRARNGIA
jgi:predicted transcriptional regulator